MTAVALVIVCGCAVAYYTALRLGSTSEQSWLLGVAVLFVWLVVWLLVLTS